MTLTNLTKDSINDSFQDQIDVYDYMAAGTGTTSFEPGQTTLANEICRLRVENIVSVDLNDSLVGYWNFDADASDSLGLHDGTVNGATLDTTNQKLGDGCYDFDGNDYITTGSFQITTGSFSISVWMNKSSIPGASTEMFACADQTGDYFQFRLFNGEVYMYVKDAGADYCISQKAITSGWHHVVGTWDNDAHTTKIYIDGVLQDTDTNTDVTITDITSILYIGINSDLSSSEYTGILDELAIWNKVLSQDEITALYNSGTGYAYKFPLIKYVDVRVPAPQADGNTLGEVGLFDSATSGNMGLRQLTENDTFSLEEVKIQLKISSEVN